MDGEHFNTLRLGEAARPILKGEVEVRLRVMSAAQRGPSRARSGRQRVVAAEATMPLAARETLAALKAWRAQVAREHNLPAFIIFPDSTLRAIAAVQPRSLAELDGISGMGVKKREAYGAEVLRVVNP